MAWLCGDRWEYRWSRPLLWNATCCHTSYCYLPTSIPLYHLPIIHEEYSKIKFTLPRQISSQCYSHHIVLFLYIIYVLLNSSKRPVLLFSQKNIKYTQFMVILKINCIIHYISIALSHLLARNNNTIQHSII